MIESDTTDNILSEDRRDGNIASGDPLEENVTTKWNPATDTTNCVCLGYITIRTTISSMNGVITYTEGHIPHDVYTEIPYTEPSFKGYNLHCRSGDPQKLYTLPPIPANLTAQAKKDLYDDRIAMYATLVYNWCLRELENCFYDINIHKEMKITILINDDVPVESINMVRHVLMKAGYDVKVKPECKLNDRCDVAYHTIKIQITNPLINK